MNHPKSYFIRRCSAFFCASLLLASAVGAQTFFTEVTDEALQRPRFGSRSTSFADYDNDGRPDMFLGEFSWNLGTHHSLSLLHNEGNGTFANQNSMIRSGIAGVPKGGGAIFGDYDNDGDLDLFVPLGAIFSSLPHRNVLLRNDRGVFTEVALEAGLLDAQPTSNAIWLDFDQDGYIDLYTANVGAGYFPSDRTVRNKLFHNNGDGSFKWVMLCVLTASCSSAYNAAVSTVSRQSPTSAPAASS